MAGMAIWVIQESRNRPIFEFSFLGCQMSFESPFSFQNKYICWSCQPKFIQTIMATKQKMINVLLQDLTLLEKKLQTPRSQQQVTFPLVKLYHFHFGFRLASQASWQRLPGLTCVKKWGYGSFFRNYRPSLKCTSIMKYLEYWDWTIASSSTTTIVAAAAAAGAVVVVAVVVVVVELLPGIGWFV